MDLSGNALEHRLITPQKPDLKQRKIGTTGSFYQTDRVSLPSGVGLSEHPGNAIAEHHQNLNVISKINFIQNMLARLVDNKQVATRYQFAC